MRITSLEIKQHEFERSFRGYNAEEVHNFLSDIAQEWDKMFNEIKMLKMQLEIAEKEASKLRDVEMTLIKTLRTAEDTSTRIAETANAEAAKKIEAARLEASQTVQKANQDATKQVEEATWKADQIIREAENTGRQLISEAEGKARDIQKASELEIAELDSRYNFLEKKKNDLLIRLKQYHSELTDLLKDSETAEVPAPAEEEKAPVEMLVKEEESVDFFRETSEKIEDDYSSGVSIPSAVNAIILETSREEEEDKTNLEIIEGIGPKIKEVLNNAGIMDFRTLATTPEYRLKDILTAAGSHFATHDPGTWNEQALLAENGQWDKLEELKARLTAGRPQASQASADGANTEEMLDKVNKVKAAIRKAMVEKSEQADTPEENPKSGSFFDSI